MPKKKKKEGKGKGGDDGEKKLPPPPNIDLHRDGAFEAMLSFKIHGKEEMVCQYEEEAEVFKERNYHMKEKNYHLKVEQSGHYKTLVCTAREHEKELERREHIEKDRVEEALKEKLQFTKWAEHNLLALQSQICEIEGHLVHGRIEVEKWQRYKDIIQHERAAYIAEMKQRMEDMEKEASELARALEERLSQTQLEIEERQGHEIEKQKEEIVERMLDALDKETRGEMADNVWLKREIAAALETLKKLQKETDALELRNLDVMKTLQREQMEDMEATRELYRSSIGRSKLFASGSSGSPGGSLPSLIDVKKCTSAEGPGGQVGQMEMRMLSVHGAKALLLSPPETVHLPPIEEKQNTLPSRTSWPVTNNMLKSFV